MTKRPWLASFTLLGGKQKRTLESIMGKRIKNSETQLLKKATHPSLKSAKMKGKDCEIILDDLIF